LLGSNHHQAPKTAAEVLSCPVNVPRFETRSSAEAQTKRNVAKSNCMAHHGISSGILWHFMCGKDAIMPSSTTIIAGEEQALCSPYFMVHVDCCIILFNIL